MANTPPIVHLDKVERRTIGNGKGFSATIARIGGQLGARALGCTLVELQPGERAWPFHLHYGAEELFVVLEGSGTLRYDEGEFPLGENEIFFAPTGEGTAHQIINTSDKVMKYLAFSHNLDPEICFYPDSGKFGSYARNRKGSELAFMANKDSALNYYDGED